MTTALVAGVISGIVGLLVFLVIGPNASGSFFRSEPRSRHRRYLEANRP